MTPRWMRRFAVFVVFVAAYAAILGVLNLTNDFIGGGIFTVVAFVGAACGVVGAIEIWYVSRRIERAQAEDQQQPVV